jgi:2-polyprenyl-6-methoxyphenol hydroxylase-like FAD-dependent oxidoreductase
MPDTDVLIAGAGPTGLVLALWLARSGVRVRVIDKEAEPGTTSRALVVHARTLELYRQLGLADAVVERGVRFAAVNLWVGGGHVARVYFGDLGAGMSPFPYLVIYPQDEHERLLIERLRALDVDVERPLELTGFDDRGDHVVARLKDSDGREETCEAAYLAGCDGAHSQVREVLQTGFPGGTYAHMFYVADAEASGPVMNHELHVALDEADFLAVFPMKGEGRARLIGTVTAQAADRHGKLEWNDVSPSVIARLGIEVKRVNWFSTYHVHHRVVSRFRKGRAFLLGDAAHIHSPVGGQGMNTGIGDAVNLAWKMAAVLQSRTHERVLDTYEPERIAFAQRLVATTDRAFQLVTSDGPLARFVRLHVVPLVLPAVFGSNVTRRLMFRTVSQTAIHYRDSVLSRGAAGKVRAGDRLPWVRLDGGTTKGADNYTPLTTLDWQVHVYGEAPAALADACRARNLPLHTFPWQGAMPSAGLERNAVYLLRPDGYIGFADQRADPQELERYVDQWQVKTRAQPVTGEAQETTPVDRADRSVGSV